MYVMCVVAGGGTVQCPVTAIPPAQQVRQLNMQKLHKKIGKRRTQKKPTFFWLNNTDILTIFYSPYRAFGRDFVDNDACRTPYLEYMPLSNAFQAFVEKQRARQPRITKIFRARNSELIQLFPTVIDSGEMGGQ